MTKRAKEILDFYRSENAGVLSNIAPRDQSGPARRHRYVRHPAGGPGF